MLGKNYSDGYMMIDKIEGVHVIGRFIIEGEHQIPFEKYLLRYANGKPQGFTYGVTFHDWNSFEQWD